ncbi:MAG: hypothetical protein VX405_05615, partial [Myxococcota bacterium]|nr:hypothetical protein [Myxococcota bacterium]
MAITRVRTIPSPFRLLWLVLFVALACQPSLPELQSLGEDGPNNLEILSLEPAGGGTALTADTVIAGQVYQLRMQVRGMQNQGLSGEPIVVSVVTDSFDELVRFPRGDRCVTPVTPAEGQERGICTVIFRLVGPTETFTLKAQAQRALFVQDEIRIEPQADQGSVRLTIQVPKSGTARWQPGEIDPLLGLAAMPLAMDDDEAAPLTITLTDAFGNPLTGARVVLMDPPEPEQEAEPPPQDAGIADTGASVSDGPEQVPDGAIVDGSSADLGLAPRTDVGGDAAVLDSSSPRDTQVSDGGIDDGNPMDGGLPDPDSGPEAGAVDGGSDAGITDGGPGDDRPKDRVLIAPWDGITGCGSTGEAHARIEGRTDDRGRILFCLLPGQQAGAWQKHILVPDLIKPEALVDDDDGAFTLSGTTRSGAPTQLELVNALEGGLALIRCDPNGFTPPILFRTLSRRDKPVSGASISLVPRGEIEVLSPLLSLTDDEGISRVLIRCPAALPAGAEITAYLIGTEESITVQIRLDVGRIDQIRIRAAEGVNPQDLGSARAGAPIRFLATAIDTDGNPAADSRLVMSVLSFVPGSSLYYRLPSSCPQDLQGGGLAGGTNVDNSSCRTDINGQIAFDLYAEGPSTLLRPTLLTVQALGQNTRAVLPIYVLPGPPERLQLLPGGQIQAALGGAAGQITARVVDEGGNGVAGIGVSFVAGSCNHDPAVQCDSDSACFDPGRCQESGAACRQSSENCQCEGVVTTASLCMPGGQPCHGGCNCEPDQSRRCQRSATDAYTLSSEAGVTDASGSVSTWVLSVNDVGSHLLRATALAPLVNFAEASEMRIVAGEGIAQQITISRGERRLFNVDGAAQINMGVGTQLDRPLTVRVETEAGGGVANHGVLVALEEGDAEACGRIALEERVTDEQGEIQLGGAGGAEVFAGPQIGPCVWLFRAGLQAARRLRIVQGPGFPFGGGPQMDDGVELVSLQRPPSEWRDPPPIATVVTLEAQDEYGNPNVGNTVWLDGENCWIRNRIQTLDEAGQA